MYFHQLSFLKLGSSNICSVRNIRAPRDSFIWKDGRSAYWQIWAWSKATYSFESRLSNEVVGLTGLSKAFDYVRKKFFVSFKYLYMRFYSYDRRRRTMYRALIGVHKYLLMSELVEKKKRFLSLGGQGVLQKGEALYTYMHFNSFLISS